MDDLDELTEELEEMAMENISEMIPCFESEIAKEPKKAKKKEMEIGMLSYLEGYSEGFIEGYLTRLDTESEGARSEN